MDEVFVRINGGTRYLWRAVDHEGEVYRNSSPFTLQFKTISTRNVTFIHEIISSLIAPPLSLNGGIFVPHRFCQITRN